MTWFALGTFDGGQGPFAGLVLGDDAVHPLAAGTTIRGLVDRVGRRATPRTALADAWPAPTCRTLAELRGAAPVRPAVSVSSRRGGTHVLELLEGRRAPR